MSIEAMKQALERVDRAIEEPNITMSDGKALKEILRQLHLIKDTLRAAIAEASMQRLTEVQQEMELSLSPDQYRNIGILVEGLLRAGAKISAIDPKTCLRSMPNGSINCGLDIRYDDPPRREWVGLTDEEVRDIFTKMEWWKPFARAIETKLKEKNS
jgi:hypothetical protein